MPWSPYVGPTEPPSAPAWEEKAADENPRCDAEIYQPKVLPWPGMKRCENGSVAYLTVAEGKADAAVTIWEGYACQRHVDEAQVDASVNVLIKWIEGYEPE